jgi:RNA polymerase sigma factor (sigma-70 family)
MAARRINEVVEYLRRTALLHDGAGLTDGQLLACFIDQGDEAALAALVRRHGPLVWSVCRRVLGDYHDAEDAFQATFLVLVRKAASVKPREMLANWLYGVASRTARKAKATRIKRQLREKQTEQALEPAVPELEEGNDVNYLLHQALTGLPDKFRASLILCYLEGKTRTEAARQMGVPEGTLAAWLARGRAMLAKRLTRRGLALPASALAATLVQSTASATVPDSLASSTIQAASLLAAGQTVSAVVSTRVVALMEGVMKGMWATKLKMTTTVVLAIVAAAGLGSGALAYRMQTVEPEARVDTIQPNEQQPPAKNDTPPEQNALAAAKNAENEERPIESPAPASSSRNEWAAKKTEDEERLIGSGKEGKKEIKVAGFDGLNIQLPIQVVVKQGKTFSVVITGDDNLLDIPKVDKEGQMLKFTKDNRWRSWTTKQPLTAQITMPSLNSVHVGSASNMTIKDFKSTKEFNAIVSGASNLEVSIEAKNVKLDASGASKIKLKASGDLNAALSGASNVEGSIESKTVKLDASGASKTKLNGSAKKAALSASGASNFQLGDFPLETANVKLDGASAATVNVKTKLDYSMSGASRLHYQGNPTIGEARSSGASSLRHGTK